MEWTVTTTADNVTRINCNYTGANDELWVLLTADRHWDSIHSDRTMQKRHLEQCRERGGLVIDVGDMFDLMQGRQDKRSAKSDLRPEYKKTDYFDAVVDDAVNWFSPYAEHFAVVGKGNHETSVLKHHEIDITNRFVTRLNSLNDTGVRVGGYGGWVQFSFLRTYSKGTKGRGTTRNLYYYHGSGGGGAVTRGVIGTNRRSTYLLADYIVTGHIHESWLLETVQVGLSTRGVPYKRPQVHIQVPTYKEEYGDGSEGWHIETGKPPKPIGAWWMKFYPFDNEIKCTIIRAD